MIYTLGFIRHQDEILLINRLKQPWKGCWNGVGGKIEHNENIQVSMQREILEETGIYVPLTEIVYKGKMTWEPNDGSFLYMFPMDINEKMDTPVVTNEGILAWRTIEWICDKNNLGVASNIPYFLPTLLENGIHHYHCIFDGNRLLDVIIKPEDTHV
jgi:8-oxo-dGTP diphosphatase